METQVLSEDRAFDLEEVDVKIDDESEKSTSPNLEPDSGTPLLKNKEKPEPDAQVTNTQVTSAVAAFAEIKPKPKPQTSSPDDQTDLPAITITKSRSASDKNGNVEKLKHSGTGQSIQFSDVVMSALSTQTSDASASPIEVCVYLMDNSGLTLLLDDGRATSADIILDFVLDELGISKKFKPCFGLWLSSPLLHLQLRPYHVPHRMAQHWGDFLVKFTLASSDQLETDEPILRLQRNAFLSPAAELSIDHAEVVRLLYCEARENILEGLYPINAESCFKLAGLAAVVDHGTFSELDHPAAFHKAILPSVLPAWVEKSQSALSGCSGSSFIARLFSRTDKVRNKLAFEVQRLHKAESERLLNAEIEAIDITLLAQRQFLKSCYQLPYYGCAFFRGILYKPPSVFSAIWNLDKSGVDATYPVTIAVSLRGVCLLDLSTAEHMPGSLLLSVPYSQMHWMTAELVDPEDDPALMTPSSPAVLPSLFLHFAHKDDDGESEALLLQIVTKQASLVDALMQACVQMHRSDFLNPSKNGEKYFSPEDVFGSGVDASDFSEFPFNWEKEEDFLKSVPELDDDQVLKTQLDRLKIKRASEIDG